MDVDTSDARPDGRDRAEDEALSDRSHRCGMGADRPASAEAAEAGTSPDGGSAGNSERDPLHDALGRRLAHVAEGFPPLADGVLVVPPLRAADAVPSDPRHRPDAGPRTGRSRDEPERWYRRQPDSEGAGRRGEAGVRRRQEDGGTQ